ncbi:MAG: tRNA (N(6)-L-threonylcarbamoyladenosine(37)-C(2))-methylthiotransferase MtaB [Clostridia bacterium]|nr:tRNA (N(6)-L-threonylcarbamoyladenosine(37)-C(2))-methylthiotransferase MtaB [Clostridia bacterium]
MKVYFYTLGCRVNQYETDAVRKLCENSGMTSVDLPEEADVVVINTCSVTGEADRKSRQQIRHMRKVNPKAIICAMGCQVEAAEGKVEADIILGTRDKKLLPDRINEFCNSEEYITRTTTGFCMHKRPEVSKEDVYQEFGTVQSPEGTRAFVKIEDGCNNFCTYCIIPYTRGRVVSREEENVVKEVMELASEGFAEVVLTGIHLCSYGKDRGEGTEALLRLLQKINAIDGIERIRLGSLEPMSLTPEFIAGLKSINKLCPHFHLSLQSGSDTVLKRMNRKYNSSEYEARVNALREVYPDMSLTTDVICGFPGETEEEFNETYEFVNRLKFSKLHVFPYSVREGTVAAKMEQVPKSISKARTAVLNDFSSKAEDEFARRFVGRKVRVLVEANRSAEAEKLSGDSGVFYTGYTEEYVKVVIKFKDEAEAKKYVGRVIEGNLIEFLTLYAIEEF